MTTVDEIREQAIQLVATAITDDEIPPAKRAELALNLLGKQAIKDTPVPTHEVTTITVTQVDADGETERIIAHYTVDTHQSEQPTTAGYGQP